MASFLLPTMVLCLVIGLLACAFWTSRVESFTATCPLASDRGEMGNMFNDYDPLNEWSNAEFTEWVITPILESLRKASTEPTSATLPCPPVAREPHQRERLAAQVPKYALIRSLSDATYGPKDFRTGVYYSVHDVMGRYEPNVESSSASESNDYTFGDATLKYETIAEQASTDTVELLPDNQRLPDAIEAVRSRVPGMVRDMAKKRDRYEGIPPFNRIKSCVVRVCRPKNKDLEHYVWRDTYLRERRSHDFQVEWTIAYTPSTKEVEVLGADIVGNEAGDVQLNSLPSSMTDRLDMSGVQFALMDGHTSIVASPNALKKTLNDRYERYVDGIRAKDYRCVDQPEHLLDKERCIATIDKLGRPKPPGIWDAPCLLDTDCPFYEANRNYPNQRGGCRRDGTCEMPVNVNRRGFRLFESRDTAHCHNCDLIQETADSDANIHECVKAQSMKQPPFEQLASPDYAFVNDRRERYAHQQELRARGLHV